jgi:1-acyl-sn-glycerol-3-phosphate acyltransferase
MYWITWTIVKIIFPFLFPIKVYGRENIPRKTAFILASNHRSNIDPMIIPICCYFKMGFVAKEELFKNKFLGWLLPQLGAISIRRGSSDVSALKQVLKALKSGKPMLIFPEGTRVLDEADRKVQSGVGFIVSKSKVPVIPLYIEGTEKVMPPRSRSLHRHPVTLTFGKPINPAEWEGHSYEQISADVMEKILSIPLPASEDPNSCKPR